MFEDAHNTPAIDQKIHAWIDREIKAADAYRADLPRLKRIDRLIEAADRELAK